MALKPVTDPNLLTALNSAPAPDPATVPGPKPVTDPALLAQLNAPVAPAFGDDIPQQPTTPVPEQPEQSVWDKFLSMSRDVLTGAPLKAAAEDPIIQMWGSGLKDIALGAPEAIPTVAANTAVQGVAGLTAPLVAGDTDDQANYIRDFVENESRIPVGESAGRLVEGLGEAFAPLGNIKQKLGETALDVTGSPAVATFFDMLPDIGLTLAGGPKAAQAAGELPKTPLKADPVVNPKVADLRAADIRLRPSDVRAMTPGAKKVPGEFREKFADAPGMKKDMTLHNQQKLTDAVAKDLGVKTLDEASLAKAKEAPSATYDMVEKVLADSPKGVSNEFANVFREAAESAKLPKDKNYSVTRVIGALRRRAAKRMQNDQVATEEAGFADRELADRLEEALGRELEAIGEPQLIEDYRAARQQFAKIHDVESSTRAGQIDAAQVLKLKKRDVPLTGGLALAADASEFAPNVTQHSLKTAARAGDEIESSREGLIKRGIKGAVRMLPGMDVGAESFQRTLGLPDEARASYAGQPPFKAAPPRAPEQVDMLGDAFDLEQPAGAVGAPPQRAPRALGSQTDMLGQAFEFQRPAGEVGIPPEAQISLQDLLGLGEPLAMKQPPGRVGKPKRKT